jgi:hypothetical protein
MNSNSCSDHSHLEPPSAPSGCEADRAWWAQWGLEAAKMAPRYVTATCGIHQLTQELAYHLNTVGPSPTV